VVFTNFLVLLYYLLDYLHVLMGEDGWWKV